MRVRAGALLATVVAALAAAGCGGSGPTSGSTSTHRPTPAKHTTAALPGPCAPAPKATLTAALGGSAHVAPHPFTPPSGVAACRFSSPGANVVSTIDSAPQAWNVYNRQTEEYAQNVLWAHQGAKAFPVSIDHLGLAADWMPADHQIITTDGVRLITVTVNALPARAGKPQALAARMARTYLGPLHNPFPNS